ncbi:9408_t:CDS:2 [Acaulospora colombiana]|uniref:9408_t:CDS:1 n=1 Tax=Acaulospora colombiana TaxID=27376 RepID=A0ACA9LQ29_9GLOM|nr:9408_t:CDS:2 [Acaulospora colombiana]
MADPNSHQLNPQHYLARQQRGITQHQLVGSPAVQHLIIDPQTQQVALAAAPPPPPSMHHTQTQFQPQHYNTLDSFWQQQVQEIRHGDHDFKVHQLPLARIKKVMKTDEEVKSSSIPVEQKMMIDPITTTLHESQHMQYMHRMESQLLHDHSEQQQHNSHNQQQLPPPYSLPPLNPVAGQQTPSSYRNPNRPPYAEMNAGSSVRQTTAEQTYQQHPSYYNQQHFQHPSTDYSPPPPPNQHPQHLDHLQQRQSDNQHPIQVKYEYEPPASRPVEWYSQSTHQHVQEGPQQQQNYNQSTSSHEGSDNIQFTRHDEGFGRVGGQQRN